MEYLKTFWSRRYLLAELVKKGIKLKYRRSYLGILWSLLEPILTTIVLTIVFGTLFDNSNKTFPVYILSGRLLYSFFSSGTKACAKSIRSNAGMIKKVYVPKYLFVDCYDPIDGILSCEANLVIITGYLSAYSASDDHIWSRHGTCDGYGILP